MRYISTRGGGEPQRFTDILLEGLAPDGGLFLPEAYPRVSYAELSSMRGMGYRDLAFAPRAQGLVQDQFGIFLVAVNGLVQVLAFPSLRVRPELRSHEPYPRAASN